MTLHFFDLATEIRQQIYREVLIGATITFETHPQANDIFHKRHPFWLLLSRDARFLSTCRRIRTEALPLVYTVIDRVTLKGFNAVSQAVQVYSTARKNQIRHLSGINTTNYLYGKYLGHFHKLETVHIQCRQAYYYAGETAFADAEYEELLNCVGSTDLDLLGPQGLYRKIELFHYRSVIVDANLCFDATVGNASRLVVPCTFDLIRKTVTKHWDRHDKVRWAAGGNPVYPELFDSPSRIANEEFETYREDQTVLKTRYAQFLDYQGWDATKRRVKKRQRGEDSWVQS